MHLLLDSQVVYLWMAGSPALGPEVLGRLASGRDRLVVSAASLWELAIKQQKGRLPLTDAQLDLLLHADFELLSVTGAHALAAARLPQHHSDPFDRLLIAQARAEGLTLVGGDAAFSAYDVDVLWG